MSSEVLSTMSLVFFVIAGACLLITIFLAIKWNIFSLIGDLSGRTAKKSIQKLRSENEKSGIKTYKSSPTNKDRGKITNPLVSPVGLNSSNNSPQENSQFETTLLNENKSALNTQQTSILNDDGNDYVGNMETTIISEEKKIEAPIVKKKSKIKLTMIDDIILIHTTETIK